VQPDFTNYGGRFWQGVQHVPDDDEPNGEGTALDNQTEKPCDSHAILKDRTA